MNAEHMRQLARDLENAAERALSPFTQDRPKWRDVGPMLREAAELARAEAARLAEQQKAPAA